ncbi:hypothetical protein ACJX0J_016853, partial [Zea mays]
DKLIEVLDLLLINYSFIKNIFVLIVGKKFVDEKSEDKLIEFSYQIAKNSLITETIVGVAIISVILVVFDIAATEIDHDTGSTLTEPYFLNMLYGSMFLLDLFFLILDDVWEDENKKEWENSVADMAANAMGGCKKMKILNYSIIIVDYSQRREEYYVKKITRFKNLRTAIIDGPGLIDNDMAASDVFGEH